MRTECRHTESWTLIIDREEGDDWPPMKTYSAARYEFAPDRITVTLTRNAKPSMSVSGLRLRQNGTPGSLRVHTTLWGSGIPDWLAEAVRAARSKHNLTEEALSR
jgi:hypothetical protein